MKIGKGTLAWFIVLFILIVDQWIKIEVKLNMELGERIRITDWFYIAFIENNGMAWGMELGSKLFLSLFRIVAVVAGVWYIHRQVKRKASYGFVILLSMIIAGAAGNIFDSLFYGLVFTESTPWQVATLTSFGNGYAPVLMGKVVDMFYFPLVTGYLPDWLPLWGGDYFVFFSPIFNFADTCISVGVIALFLFFRKELNAENDDVEGVADI